MLFCVKMTVTIDPGADPVKIDALKAEEKRRALELQRSGVWRHLWRVVGRYENISIFDVPDNDTLHRILADLPLFPYMEVTVTPLAVHPSALIANT